MNTKGALLAILMIVSALAVPRCAAADPQSSVKAGTLLVTWDVTPESGRTSAIVSRSGELARFSISKERSYAISATADGGASQPVIFRILTVREAPGGAGEILKQVEKFTLLPGATYSTALKPALVFRLNKVSDSGDGTTSESSGSPKKPSALVAWEVRTPTQEKVRFVGRDGETVRLELSRGRVLGMKATILDSNSVDFRLLDLGQDANPARQLDAFTISLGTEHQAGGLAVRLTSIKPGPYLP
ncbi:MAG TPA: hypothetical protein VFC23_03735 [Thermoanaerobaculia bacterium]|nr:hypothetical protein [Thermoanaerobaculia bacterium]